MIMKLQPCRCKSYMIAQFGIAGENIKIQRLILMYDTKFYLHFIDGTLTLFFVTNNTTFRFSLKWYLRPHPISHSTKMMRETHATNKLAKMM